MARPGAALEVLVLLAAACGGAQIPNGNGYRSPNAKPWKKARHLKLDDKNEAKADGDLSYPKMRRAAWYLVTLPQPGDLKLSVDITPGDNVSDDFDLGFEVLDSGYRKIVRQDNDEGDQQGNEQKTAALKDLEAGEYYIHLYLQGRLDSADYVIHATYKPGTATAQGSSDFPAEVAFLPPLPMVPIQDDTPKSYHPPQVAEVHVIHHGHHPRPEPKPAAATKITARIVNIAAVSGGTQITVARGTENGASVGMAGAVVGVPNGGFVLANCDARTCTAIVKLSTDQLKAAFSVQLGP